MKSARSAGASGSSIAQRLGEIEPGNPDHDLLERLDRGRLVFLNERAKQILAPLHGRGHGADDVVARR
jgi:hypothetical protein